MIKRLCRAILPVLLLGAAIAVGVFLPDWIIGYQSREQGFSKSYEMETVTLTRSEDENLCERMKQMQEAPHFFAELEKGIHLTREEVLAIYQRHQTHLEEIGSLKEIHEKNPKVPKNSWHNTHINIMPEVNGKKDGNTWIIWRVNSEEINDTILSGKIYRYTTLCIDDVTGGILKADLNMGHVLHEETGKEISQKIAMENYVEEYAELICKLNDFQTVEQVEKRSEYEKMSADKMNVLIKGNDDNLIFRLYELTFTDKNGKTVAVPMQIFPTQISFNLIESFP